MKADLPVETIGVKNDDVRDFPRARRAEIAASPGKISFTLIESLDRLSKKFNPAPDGSVITTGLTQLSKGVFALATFDTGSGVAAVLGEIGALFDALSSKQAIVLGVMKDGIAQGTLVTKEVFEKGGTTALTRSQIHLGWPDGFGLLFFDGDGVNDLPTRLPALYPPLADAAMLVRPSASGSVVNTATGKALSESEHCFVVIDDPAQSKACLNALMRLAWVKGTGKSGGRLELKKNGHVMPKGPIDAAVGAAERLVYEGAAEIHPRLITLPRKSHVVGGRGILCAADLVAYADLHAPEAQYKELIEAAKREPDFVALRQEVMAAYRADHIERGVSRGEPREKVEKTFDKLVRARGKQKGDRLWKELSPHHTFYRDRGEAFSGLDILADPMKFHKAVCADPIEGMDYQTTNCGWIVITSERINIYSQAHGGAFAYFIKMPADLLFQTQMKQVHEAMASSSAASSTSSSMSSSSSSSPPPLSAPAVTVVDNPMNKLQPFAEIAELMLEQVREQGEDLLFVADKKGVEHLWWYSDGLWSLVLEPETLLNLQIEITLRDNGLRKFSFAKFIAEARRYIERSPDIRSSTPIVWDDHGKVSTRSGLIDPVTLKIEPLKKEDYATWRIEIDYDPEAVCPLWEELLSDYFIDHTPEEKAKSITLLQDILGTTLIDRLPKALKVALVLWGASDTGKSQLLRILSGLTSNKPISTPLSEINKTHGLEEFTRRAPWVLDEAFNLSDWHLSDRVKAIISRETLSINVKNHPLLTMPINAPALWGTNHSPTFKENTEAILNRLKIVPLKRVFKKGEYVGVAAKARKINPAWEPSDLILAREKAGLLQWALIGLQRALKRGNFVNTAEGTAALDAMRLESNPVSGFVDDCILFDPEKMMSTADFCAAFTGWREASHGGEKITLGRNIIGKNLVALAHPRIGQDKNVFKEETGRRYYMGITFNKEGAAHFNEVRKHEYYHPKWVTQGTSQTAKDAIRAIPDKWRDHPAVRRNAGRHPNGGHPGRGRRLAEP
jgi:phage/plasmid-associated DNA primase